MEKLNELLIFYTDYINLIVEYNQKIKSYEELNIKTPKEIEEFLESINISANFLVITSECVAIVQAFNNNKRFLYQIFFVKSIYKIVYETFILLQKYHEIILSNEDESLSETKEKISLFRKEYKIDEIAKIRNTVSSHYTPDFMEQITITKNLDMDKSFKMLEDFLTILVGLNNYLIHEKLSIELMNSKFSNYYSYVESELRKL